MTYIVSARVTVYVPDADDARHAQQIATHILTENGWVDVEDIIDVEEQHDD